MNCNELHANMVNKANLNFHMQKMFLLSKFMILSAQYRVSQKADAFWNANQSRISLRYNLTIPMGIQRIEREP